MPENTVEGFPLYRSLEGVLEGQRRGKEKKSFLRFQSSGKAEQMEKRF